MYKKSPSTRQKRPKPHNSDPLKSLENRGNVGGDVTDFCSMVGKEHDVDRSRNDGLEVAVELTTKFGDNYDIHGELGRGKFAVVKKCKHRSNGKEFAAKFQRKRRKGKDCRKEIIQEVKMLELDHPYLVQLVEVFETSNEMIIVTEYAAGGELFQHIMMEDGFEETEVIRLLRQILTGLLYLHERDIVHLDVKVCRTFSPRELIVQVASLSASVPQNILLTAEPPHGNIKLCDFGFARTIKSKDEVRDIIGTPDYVAPEVLSYEPLHTPCDMWGVGVLAYVMLTGCSPFAGENKMETFSNITQLKYDFPDELFESISQHAIDFMKKLLKKEPEDRMTALQSLKHPWLYDEKQKLAHPISPTKSPFGSPLGCRRTLTPSPGEILETEEPLKKCKCAFDSSVDESDVKDDEKKENTIEKVDKNSASDNEETFGAPSDSDQCMCSSTDDLDDILSSNEMLDDCSISTSCKVITDEISYNHDTDKNNYGNNVVPLLKVCDNMSVGNDNEETLPVINEDDADDDKHHHQIKIDDNSVLQGIVPCDVVNTSHLNIHTMCDNIEFIQQKEDCDNDYKNQSQLQIDHSVTELVGGSNSDVAKCYFMYDNKPEILMLKSDDPVRNHDDLDHDDHDLNDLSNSHSSIEADEEDFENEVDNAKDVHVDDNKQLRHNSSIKSSGMNYFPVVTFGETSQNCSQNNCSDTGDRNDDLVNGNGGDIQNVIMLVSNENDDVNETDC